jgi:hypothetical protein
VLIVGDISKSREGVSHKSLSMIAANANIKSEDQSGLKEFNPLQSLSIRTIPKKDWRRLNI